MSRSSGFDPSSASDEELLGALGEALRATVPGAGPSAAELGAFRSVVDGVVPMSVAGRARSWSAQRRLRAALVASVAAVVLVVLGAFTTMPRPARTVLSATGLVDKPAVRDAKASLSRLEAALEIGDALVIERSAAAARRQVSALSGADRAAVEPNASSLLKQADEALAASRTPRTTTTAPAGGGTGAGAAPTTAAPATVPPPLPRPPSTSATTVESDDGHESDDHVEDHASDDHVDDHASDDAPDEDATDLPGDG